MRFTLALYGYLTLIADLGSMELAGGNEIVDSFYDHENWCVVIRKL